MKPLSKILPGPLESPRYTNLSMSVLISNNNRGFGDYARLISELIEDVLSIFGSLLALCFPFLSINEVSFMLLPLLPLTSSLNSQVITMRINNQWCALYGHYVFEPMA